MIRVKQGLNGTLSEIMNVCRWQLLGPRWSESERNNAFDHITALQKFLPSRHINALQKFLSSHLNAKLEVETVAFL